MAIEEKGKRSVVDEGLSQEGTLIAVAMRENALPVRVDYDSWRT